MFTMQRIRRRFTPIELMIVVASVGILPACALPQHHVYGAHWAENLQSAAELKQAIAECVRKQAGSLTTPMAVTALQV